MPVQHRVTCITKPNVLSAHEHITHIGGVEGGRWKITREEAIRRIDQKTDAYYVVDPKNSSKVSVVGVVRSGNTAPYLRTYSDGNWDNNLLSLTQCPLF